MVLLVILMMLLKTLIIFHLNILTNISPQSMSKSYESTNPKYYWDNVFETLIKSHNYKKFLEVLKKFFVKYNKWDENDYKKYFEIPMDKFVKSESKVIQLFVKECEFVNVIEKYIKSKQSTPFDNSKIIPNELVQIMNFFNYYFSSVKKYNTKTYVILIESKYSEKVIDDIYNKYNGILYHITLKENLPRILKRGLQTKGDKNIYRYIEPRIYFIVENDEEKLNQYINKIALQKGYSNDELVVLKIDLNSGVKNKFTKSSYSIDFYKDLFYKDGYAVYTYGLIHPRFISIYKE